MCSKLIASLACLGFPALLGSCDFIELQNASGDAGLLVDGAESSNGTVVNDRGWVRIGNGDISINVGRLTSAATPNREMPTRITQFKRRRTQLKRHPNTLKR